MSQAENGPLIKCLVWDLDHTIWNGVLLEGDRLDLLPEVRSVLETLDARGILHSIASRNEETAAMRKLGEFGLSQYFLYPEIHWNAKSSSLQAIASRLNIGLDAIAFVDDQPFELEEVSYVLPQVLCIHARDVAGIPAMPRMKPSFITEDSRKRREMYQSDARRNEAEKAFAGSNEQFLASLNMVFAISRAGEDDLERAEELTMRTHQLNATGYTYSYDELSAFIESPDHLLLVSRLEDKYGSYGTIGLCLLECAGPIWTVKLLLMSCRVISRGVGMLMLHHVMSLAKKSGIRLRAEFVPNERNRMMYITYKFSGFEEIEQAGGLTVLETDLSRIQPAPSYMTVHVK